MDSRNPYAPPQADLVQGTETQGDTPFLSVSQTKLAFIYFLSFGLYLLPWFYGHWSRIKAREGTRIWPAPRSIFYIFFTHALFRRIRQEAQGRAIPVGWSPGTLATLFVALAVIANVLGNIPTDPDTIHWLDLTPLAPMVALYFPLRTVQETANLVNSDPQGARNSRFTALNWIAAVLGGLLWVGLAIGLAAIFFGLVPAE